MPGAVGGRARACGRSDPQIEAAMRIVEGTCKNMGVTVA